MGPRWRIEEAEGREVGWSLGLGGEGVGEEVLGGVGCFVLLVLTFFAGGSSGGDGAGRVALGDRITISDFLAAGEAGR